MVSDEQSSPWLPVNPPRESEDATPDATADATESATADAAQSAVPDAAPGAADAAPGSTTPPSSPGAPGNTPLPTPPAAPWIAQEWSAPSGDTAAPPAAASHETAQFGESAQPRTGQIPRVPLADVPFTEQPTLSHFAPPAPPATPTSFAPPASAVPAAPASVESEASEPESSAPSPTPERSAASPEPESSAPSPQPEPSAASPAPVIPPEPVTPPRSPYLTGELPKAESAPSRPSLFAPADTPAHTPAPSPTPQESWTNPQAQHAQPFETPTRDSDQSAAKPIEPELTPVRPVVPGTGSIPVVSPPAPTPAAGPFAPPAAPAWEGKVPEPIDIDDDDTDVVPPIEPPPAEEILPTVGSEPVTPETAWAWDGDASPTPPSTDPVRDLGTSAVSAASLQAAGAPTPASETPPSDFDNVPDFGPDEPFVPRFEPPTPPAATPPAVTPPTPAAPSTGPSVSFQPPAPRPVDPLSNLEVPTSDEPAYTPTLATDRPGSGAGVDGTGVDGAAPDATGADDAEIAPRGSGPATPIEGWPYRMDDAAADTAAGVAESAQSDAASPAVERSPGVPDLARPSRAADTQDALDAPFTPLAPEHFDDILAENPFAAAAPLPADPGARPWASVLSESAREDAEPAPSEPAPSAPASAGGDAPTSGAALTTGGAPTASDTPDRAAAQPEDAERRPAPYSPLVTTFQPGAAAKPTPASETSEDDDADDAGFAGAPVTSATDTDKPRRKGGMSRTKLILIIIAAGLVAGAIGVVVYRTFLLPEPITLPAPTVTAEPRTAQGPPVIIEEEEASEFLAAMPTEVGANVLMAYEVRDPVGDESLPARAAEHVVLGYGSGVGEPEFTVHAYQHYHVEDAQTAYDAYAAGAPDVEDVTVDGEVVGQRAFQAASATGQLAWRNDTAVFVLTGPASELVHFYERFGL